MSQDSCLSFHIYGTRMRTGSYTQVSWSQGPNGRSLHPEKAQAVRQLGGTQLRLHLGTQAAPAMLQLPWVLNGHLHLSGDGVGSAECVAICSTKVCPSKDTLRQYQNWRSHMR